MITYSVNFENQTPDTWTLCVYQLLPDTMNVDVVAWKLVKVPANSISSIKWETADLVCIADYKHTGGKGYFMPYQYMRSYLGEKWNCVVKDGIKQLEDGGKGPEGQLLLFNNALQLANLGIGMDHDITAVKRNVYSGTMVQFVVKPKYYVALFDDIRKGQIIRGDQINGPLEVNFQNGQYEKSYVARIEGSTFIFEESGAGFKAEVPYEQVLERIKELEREGE
ncbi:MAG: hypothetical protein ACN6OJ_08275 [Chryseobacterium sp.]|uniref:hypothetical protein n=1 Tax=Chryseobacterium sp. TaxID=1871047 RepID=UPI003D0B5B6E